MLAQDAVMLAQKEDRFMLFARHGNAEASPRTQDARQLVGSGWARVGGISIFWFALNFHWSALLTVVLPSQVLALVGSTHKVDALAFVLIPGAFVSLIANPLWGWLSDQSRGWLARRGRRRPYILCGTLVNIGGLLWMASARDIVTLAFAYALVQFANNATQAPFHALLPDIVPPQQRGTVSGIMGFLMIAGTIAGVVLAGLLLDSSTVPTLYWRGIWLVYGCIIVVMFGFMLLTVLLMKEKVDARASSGQSQTWKTLPGRLLRRAGLQTVTWTAVAVVLLWGLFWLCAHLPGGPFRVSGDVQQVALEVVVTMGLLRLFDFHPRRHPDFAWVLLTRFLVSLGMALIQNWMQYYLQDVLQFQHAELVTAQFLSVVAIAGLCSAALAGWLSDRWGRKRLVYVAGGMMALVGISVVVAQAFTHATAVLFPVLLGAGVLFGIGYGAYQSVDWALVADTLPSRQHYARDMGVWNISLSLPQMLAPVVAGPLITTFAQRGQIGMGYQLLFMLAALCCLCGTAAVRAIRGGVGRCKP
jgi:MFS family permease